MSIRLPWVMAVTIIEVYLRLMFWDKTCYQRSASHIREKCEELNWTVEFSFQKLRGNNKEDKTNFFLLEIKEEQ